MARTRVLIVGGGIAGVSLGCELAVDHGVVLLEAEEQLAVHSTGRSAALLIPDYGPEAVRALTRASETGFDRLSSECDMPQLLMPRGGLMTASDDVSSVQLEMTLQQPDSRLSLIPIAAASALCPALSVDTLRAVAFDHTTRDIDVMALHSTYVRTLKRLGGEIHLGAAAARVTRSSEGWQVRSRDGRTWAADIVVNAAGAWGDEVAGLCGVSGHGLQARRRTIVIARPATGVNSSWPLVQDAAERWYFKPEGGAVLLSPEDATPVPPGDVKPDPLDVATGLERVNAVTNLGLRSVQTSWAGLRTFAPDGVPVVGSHPEDDSLFCFLGQGGYGIQMAPALAALAGQLLRTGRLGTPQSWLRDALDPGRSAAPVAGQ